MTDDLVNHLRRCPYDFTQEAADRIEQLKALLEQRDAFIVSKDLWFEFVDGLTLAGGKGNENAKTD